MKLILASAIVLFSFALSFGQGEQAPIIEKDVLYKDWTYKNVNTGEDVNLRSYTKRKKLVIVVYFAPWCGNWRHDAPMLQRLYDQYKSKGLAIVGVGEYDSVAAMKANLETLKVTFPVVSESENRAARTTSLHYGYRQATGDKRGWGSPWYVFLKPSTMEKKGDVLIKKTSVINGEMIESEGETFIRKELGMPAKDMKAPVTSTGKS